MEMEKELLVGVREFRGARRRKKLKVNAKESKLVLFERGNSKCEFWLDENL